MGLQSAPGFILGGGTFQHPAELMRNIVQGLAGGAGKGTVVDNSFAFTPSGSVMQLTVGAGWAVIDGLENTSQGSYYAWSNASEVLAWPAHSSQGRWDALILRVIDKQYGTDPGSEGALWEIVQGTPAGSPAKIADAEFLSGGDFYRPGAWYRVADVLVPSTATNMAACTITSYVAPVKTNDQRLAVGYALSQRVVYTASSTFVKANYPLGKKVKVSLVGGGGAGGSSAAPAASNADMGSGGGGGCYAESWIDFASLGSSVTVTIGAAGAPGAAGANPGGAGGSTSFGSLVIGPGGAGGGERGVNTSSFGIAGGSGGAGGTGDVTFDGGAGQMGWGDGQLGVSGAGGNSHLGGGANANRTTAAAGSIAGVAATSYGGGGSGAVVSGTGAAKAGGAGAPGIVIVEVYV